AQLALLGGRSTSVRYSMTPEQLWRSYQKDLSRHDVALIPVPVQNFVTDKKMPEPTKLQLEKTFADYKIKKFNPRSDVPGFIPPEKIKVAYVMAEAESKYYQEKSKGLLALERDFPAPAVWDIGVPGLLPAVQLAATRAAWEHNLYSEYE